MNFTMVSQEDIDVAFAKHLERVAEDHYLDLRVERAFAKNISASWVLKNFEGATTVCKLYMWKLYGVWCQL